MLFERTTNNNNGTCRIAQETFKCETLYNTKGFIQKGHRREFFDLILPSQNAAGHGAVPPDLPVWPPVPWKPLVGSNRWLNCLMDKQTADLPKNWTSKLLGRALDHLHTRFLNSGCMSDIRICLYVVCTDEA